MCQTLLPPVAFIGSRSWYHFTHWGHPSLVLLGAIPSSFQQELDSSCEGPSLVFWTSASIRVLNRRGAQVWRLRMCGCPPQLHRMDPHPHCQHLADRRRPSLCPSSRHLSVAISFCFKLTWAVISAGYPVSKELNSLQLFSACRPLWEAVKICKSRCLSLLSWGIFFFPFLY